MSQLLRFAFTALVLLPGAGLFAQGADAPPVPPDQSFTQTMVMLTIAIGFFYLILWRPEQKRRKAQEAQREALKKGDKVTAMGIVGIVSKVTEKTVIVKMYDGSKLEFLKGAINDVEAGESKAEASEGKRVELAQAESK